MKDRRRNPSLNQDLTKVWSYLRDYGEIHEIRMQNLKPAGEGLNLPETESKRAPNYKIEAWKLNWELELDQEHEHEPYGVNLRSKQK